MQSHGKTKSVMIHFMQCRHFPISALMVAMLWSRRLLGFDRCKQSGQDGLQPNSLSYYTLSYSRNPGCALLPTSIVCRPLSLGFTGRHVNTYIRTYVRTYSICERTSVGLVLFFFVWDVGQLGKRNKNQLPRQNSFGVLAKKRLSARTLTRSGYGNLSPHFSGLLGLNGAIDIIFYVLVSPLLLLHACVLSISPMPTHTFSCEREETICRTRMQQMTWFLAFVSSVR